MIILFLYYPRAQIRSARVGWLVYSYPFASDDPPLCVADLFSRHEYIAPVRVLLHRRPRSNGGHDKEGVFSFVG